MLELIQFSKGKAAYYLGMIAVGPYLIALKAGLVSATTAKEKLLGYFFGKMPVTEFNSICKRFSEERLPQLIRPKAIAKIREHQQHNDTVTVVSASAENWVSFWCVQNNIHYLTTKLEVVNDTLTGKLFGNNCNAEEKVNRIKQQYNLSDYTTIYCYGDTDGDKPMLALASFANYKPFRN